MNRFSLLAIIAVASLPSWMMQSSNVTARLRGISAVDTHVAWASGSDSTVLRTNDGGTTWQRISVSPDRLDFRDIDAINEQTVYALSIGSGTASRIYKTTDGGRTWKLQFINNDPKAFLDAMSFWDAKRGLVIGDSVAGQLFILSTDDGGEHWNRIPQSSLPPALENEGAFAASGTNISVGDKTHAWIGLGAAAKARVLRTIDS